MRNGELVTAKIAKKGRGGRKANPSCFALSAALALSAVKSFCYFRSANFCVASCAASPAGFSFLISS